MTATAPAIKTNRLILNNTPYISGPRRPVAEIRADSTINRVLVRGVFRHANADAAAAWALGFVPVVYLGLSGGGYDIVARSQIGILAWWAVLVGAIIGILPRTRLSPLAWATVALLAAFFVWTWIATGWTQSEERTLAETARLGTYLGVLVLALCLASRGALRPMLCGLAGAIALVSALAVLSRLIPSWFPADVTRMIYATSRLSYPFDYSDGVGEFAALGFPVLLYVATGARSLVGRALGVAAIPVVTLCVALTVSRGGILATAVGVVFFFALVPDRLPRIGTGLIAAAASAVVLLALFHRAGVRYVLHGQAPAGQRHAMLAVVLLASAAAGLVQAGATILLRRRERPRWSVVSPRGGAIVGAAIAAAVVAVVLFGIASGTDHHLWQQFKRANGPATGSQYSRLLSIAGSHRYQYWQAAIAAFKTSPWKGIGPGTFEFYWAQHNTLNEFVRNAHSLYLETLAEAGIIGLALIAGFLALALVGGAARSFRKQGEPRLAVASAVAGVAAFCAAAAFDWVWQIGVIPIIAMVLVAVAVAPVSPSREASRSARGLAGRRIAAGFGGQRIAAGFGGQRIVLGLGCLAALWAIVGPLSTTTALRSSQSASSHGNLRKALTDAATAQEIEPGSASPRLQRALILEQLGDVSGASQAIGQAEQRERTNWRIWLVASRIATEAGKPAVALSDYRRARSLNPTSPIFQQ
jgi:O-Antigen ligase